MAMATREKRRVKAWLAASVIAAAALIAQSASTAPGDLVLSRDAAAGGLAPAIFPHWLHRVRYRCDSCHSKLFEMQLGASEISMELIAKGKSCGACHNGRQAFAVSFQSCVRCHVAAEN